MLIKGRLTAQNQSTIIESRNRRYDGNTSGIHKGHELTDIILESTISINDIKVFCENKTDAYLYDTSYRIGEKADSKLENLAQMAGCSKIIVLRAILDLKYKSIVTANNRNQNLAWALEHQIEVDSRILNGDIEMRGVYCWFIGELENEEAVYVGRASCVYDRLFRGECHIFNLKNGRHVNKLLNALQQKKHVSVRIIETVPLIGDHPAKDAQRLASCESKWIDYYQEKNMCLEQYPEGRWC